MATILSWTARLFLLTASYLTLCDGHSLFEERNDVIARALPGSWTSLGCVTDDSTGSRTLAGSAMNSATLNATSCINFCIGGGFIYAGTEYSDECYCGNTLATGSTNATLTDCNMECSGGGEACGGPNLLNLYTSGEPAPAGPEINPGPSGWVSDGCYVDSVNARTLTTGMATAGGAANLTVALCTSACAASKFSLAGVEFGEECYCGTEISNGGVPASDGGCTQVCNGNSTEVCGGGSRINIYSLEGVNVTVAPTATSTAPDAPTTDVSKAVTTLAAGWAYKGCYTDNIAGRILRQGEFQDTTVESCVAQCVSLGASVAGIEYGGQCFCDDFIVNGGNKTTDSACAMACTGNVNEICGGPNLMSVYSNLTTIQAFPVPVQQRTDLPGSWEYQGCLQDNVNNQRTFMYELDQTLNASATNCLNLCAEYGYMAGGIEFAMQCMCGDVSDIAKVGAEIVDDSLCSDTCTGDPSYYCGGGNLISYYKWTGTPLNTWAEPTGSDAGEYQFLIGGLIVPLIAIAGVNGKVSFLEKHGTEYAGDDNSTGAFELDLSLIDQGIDVAWREMTGLQTDVFCSAGLVLPDKAGRIINVGGWSLDSTFGTRFYTPDGSPGTNSTNQWEENVNEVKLLNGRWYPSAMTMANGSILVVGGEDGSNGAPVPTLELLPTPGGGNVIFCDYLNRTDPNNLYPFLAVLPGGGVFIQYYNEARVLDENTFETTRFLPNVPGSVVSFLAGRNYPLEGTAVLMPQHAPYTDLLTIMICGGSTPFTAVALDNCVSIQPEASNPEWVIERMPSQRVMSCITALPDGTFLILNGGLQGVAGFGLSNTPNLNAVLYDPSKPINSRMSIMNNTIVARLYHSEAILLQDGRVLVSGSDPEDTENPQEFRVEVFVPPYLLSGASRPAYTISNTDIGYGDTFEITVTAGTVGRVSLIGATASTHGNSMGQRTIFPEFSCSGGTCTVTAPPNAHVCPPGWHQLFVLDGPTPSLSQWVRIGGDPAELGNWPNFPDFTLPGV